MKCLVVLNNFQPILLFFWYHNNHKVTLANKIARIKSFHFLNSFSTSKFFDLFAVIFLLKLDNLASKFVFVIELPCANLVLKTSAAKILNSEVVIYLS